MNQGILLASGGIDSTVLMYYLAKNNRVQHVLFCDYGQASAERQNELLESHCIRLKLPYTREKIDWPDYAKGRGYIFEKGKYPEPMEDPYEALRMSPSEVDDYLEAKWDFLQGRNITFLARAGAFALANKCNTLYTAFQFDEPEWREMNVAGSKGCDTSPAFVAAFNQLAKSGGFSKPLVLLAPFLDLKMTKEDIVKLGRIHCVPLSQTHSCEFYPPCGGCHQCLVRRGVLGKQLKFL